MKNCLYFIVIAFRVIQDFFLCKLEGPLRLIETKLYKITKYGMPAQTLSPQG